MPYLEYGKIDELTEKRLVKITSSKSFRSYWRKKRIFDIIVSLFILILAIIPILLVALAIFIDDPHGNPFYKQIRIGRHGKEFYMYKFRTMYVDADKR